MNGQPRQDERPAPSGLQHPDQPLRQLIPDGRTGRAPRGWGSAYVHNNGAGPAHPDNAVIKTGPGGPSGYEIEIDYCKGCGICAAECPCSAISTVPEPA